MTRLVRLLLGAYLAIFAPLARDPKDARSEQELLLGSLEYAYDDARAAGHGRVRATLITVRLHAGELQPLAVITRVRAANQRAARAGVGGRRIALRLLALPAIAASAALWIWGMDALGWIFLGFTIFMLTLMLWSARHAGARWLMLLIPLFMIWPLVEIRSAPGRGPAITEAASLCILIGVALGAHQLWRWGHGDFQRWRALATLVIAPLWWTLATSLHAAVYWIVFPHGYAGPVTTWLGVPADDAIVAVSLFYFGLLALYWLAVALTVARVAACHQVVPSDAGAPREWS